MTPNIDLLTLLCDGCFHSGEQLGNTLNLSRSTICNHIRVLQSLGLGIHAISGKGYRLHRPLELLNEQKIIQTLDDDKIKYLSDIEVHHCLDSTNQYLMNKAIQGHPSGAVCLSEYQEAGRGRQGRAWHSPFASNLYLSILWTFDSPADYLKGLSLAIGFAVAQTLEISGLQHIKLKWPNDVFYQDKKLAGILLEMIGEASGPCRVIIGIGINVAMPNNADQHIDQPWIDLETIIGQPVSRNQLCAQLLNQLIDCLTTYQAQGLSAFAAPWQAFDMLKDQPVTVSSGGGIRHGMACGIDDTGALLLEESGQRHPLHSGDVSVRLDKPSMTHHS